MKLEPKLKEATVTLLNEYPKLPRIIDALAQLKATPFLVGGAVRDLLLGIPCKDVDIEVHDISLDRLEEALGKFGPVDLVGKAYGVLRLHGLEVDWSVPRSDEVGRKPEVTLDPSMSVKDAFERRDLTMNAMGINLVDYTLEDPFDGYKDMQEGILRTPSVEKFIEDPLRFYRVMQFIGRFGMLPDKELNALCKKIDISAVSKERITQEFAKWLLKSPKPSIALDWLDTIGRLKELFPEIYILKSVPQWEKYHPEGDVYEHTKQALDAAARLAYENDSEKLLMMYAALCHDLGKAVATQKRAGGKISSYGHDEAGAKIARKMLKRIMNNKELVDNVTKLVALHMQPIQLIKQNARPAAYKRLAKKLSPLSMMQLAKLFQVDRQGRNPKRGQPLATVDEEVQLFKDMAKKAGIYEKPEAPILMGKDLIADVEPGPEMGKLLQKAYNIQINNGITDKNELKRRVLQT